MTVIESLFVRQEHGTSNNILVEIDAECPIKEHTYVVISSITATQQNDINALSNQVTNGGDVEKLLDHVNWRMFIYSCEQQSCCNSTYSSYQLQYPNCSNTTCCFSDGIDDLFSYFIRCGNTSCTDFINSFAGQTWLIALISGLLCLLGNAVVMCYKATSLCKAQNKGKKIQIYNILVFNLALADFLMGVYLTAIAFEIKRKANNGVYYSEPTLCNILAIVNNVSSQVSLTIIFIISYYRLVGVIYPYKKQHFRFVVTIIILTWSIWLVVASLPVFPFEPFKTIFTFGIIKNRKVLEATLIDFSYFILVFQSKILPGFSNVTEVTSITHAVTQFPTSSVLQKFFTALGWINSDRDDWDFVGYYDLRYTCSITYFAENESFRSYSFYALMLVFCNLVLSITTLIFYIIVTFKIYESSCLHCVYCKQCLNFFSGKKSNNNAIVGPAKAMRAAENREIFRRISIIVITDLICWIPLCITSLIIWKISNATVISWEEYLAIAVPFQTATLILVPVNSVANPYIDSYKLWIQLFKKIQNVLYRTKVVSYCNYRNSNFG